MGIEQMDYPAILADLENKRQALDQTIAAFRAAMALGALGQPGDVPSSGVSGSSYSALGDVPAGAFLGKSIPDATKLYLQIVKKKQTSKEIAEALLKGGMESASNNFPQIVHSVLDRARKANTGIVKLDRSFWGLAEWYPATLRNSVGQEKRGAKKKSARKKSRKQTTDAIAKSSPPEPSTSTPPTWVGAPATKHEQVAQFFQMNRGKEISPSDVAKNLGLNSAGVRLIMGLMVKKGKLEKTASGSYRAPAPQLVAAGA